MNKTIKIDGVQYAAAGDPYNWLRNFTMDQDEPVLFLLNLIEKKFTASEIMVEFQNEMFDQWFLVAQDV